MPSRRISITVSETQCEHLETRARRQGVGITAHVYNLAVEDIKAGFSDGSLGNTSVQSPQLGEFIHALASDDGITLELIDEVCQLLNIPVERMRYTLGLDEELVEGKQLEENVTAEVVSEFV